MSGTNLYQEKATEYRNFFNPRSHIALYMDLENATIKKKAEQVLRHWYQMLEKG